MEGKVVKQFMEVQSFLDLPLAVSQEFPGEAHALAIAAVFALVLAEGGQVTGQTAAVVAAGLSLDEFEADRALAAMAKAGFLRFANKPGGRVYWPNIDMGYFADEMAKIDAWHREHHNDDGHEQWGGEEDDRRHAVVDEDDAFEAATPLQRRDI